MSVETVTCLVVTCDGCGQVAPCEDLSEEPGSLHFRDLADARETLVDTGYEDEEYRRWVLDDDGSALCVACLRKKTCAEKDHEYSGPWRACRCGGKIASHPANDDHGRRFRYCGRCSVIEYEPAAPAEGGQQ